MDCEECFDVGWKAPICIRCRGDGVDIDLPGVECERCDGTGEEPSDIPYEICVCSEVCEDCKGNGTEPPTWVDDSGLCGSCDGARALKKEP